MLNIDNILPNTKTTEKIKESIKKENNENKENKESDKQLDDKLTLLELSYDCETFLDLYQEYLKLEKEDRIKFANTFDIKYWEFLKSSNISKLKDFKFRFNHLEYYEYNIKILNHNISDFILFDKKNNIYYITDNQLGFRIFNNLVNIKIFNIDKYSFVDMAPFRKLNKFSTLEKCILCPWKDICNNFNNFKEV